MIITTETPGSEFILVIEGGKPVGGVTKLNLNDRSYTRFLFHKFQEWSDYVSKPGSPEPELFPPRQERPELYEDGTYDSLMINGVELLPPLCQDVQHVERLLLDAIKVNQPKEQVP